MELIQNGKGPISDMVSSLASNRLHYVPKGWGYELWLVNKKEYCGKLLYFIKDRHCSFHYHKIKDETFYVHSGRLNVEWSMDNDLPQVLKLADLPHDRGVVVLEPGDTFHVPVGMRHRMTGLTDTVMFEFSTQHFDEDSYRVIKGD